MPAIVPDGDASQRAIWRRIRERGIWPDRGIAIGVQAVYHRLDRDGTALMATLFQLITPLLAARLRHWTPNNIAPFATGTGDDGDHPNQPNQPNQPDQPAEGHR